MEENQIQAVDNTQKKKSPVLTIILVLIALAGTGFGVYGMLFNKSTDTPKCPAAATCDNSESTSDDKDNTEKKDGDYTIYYDLVKKYLDHSAFEHDFERNGFDDENYMAETAVKEIKTAGNIDSISAARLNKKVYELFNYDFSNVDEIEILCAKYTFSNNVFYRQDGGCGGAGDSTSIFTIDNVEKGDGSLVIGVIYTNILYYGGDGEMLSLKDKTNNEVYSDVGGLYEGEGVERVKQYFEDNLDKFQKYKLTFKKADKHYYLESGEKID